MKVALIPCIGTEWQQEGRLLGRVELPWSQADQQQCAQWVGRLKELSLRRILHAPDELSTTTAQMLARLLGVPAKALDDLVEVDLGLWTGLTEAQLKARFASAHRELRESPLNVSPPDGENLGAASERLTACIRKQIRKNGRANIGVVMRPVGLALTKCALERGELADVWETARHADQPVIIALTESGGGDPAG